MKDVSDVVAVVVDRGIFFSVAERLARDLKKVYYHMPSGDAFKTFAKGILGDGHDDVALIDDFWKIKSEVDLFVFPDCADAGLQSELMSQGFKVWGSKGVGSLEEMRGQWLKKCDELKWPMPKTHQIQGITNLWLFLKEHDGEIFYVKISKWRGDAETFRAFGLAAIQNKLDVLALKFGPFKERITFFVQEELDTKIEGGADTYFVGDYPDKIVLGYEKKGESYFATVKNREEMPKEIWEMSEQLSPTLQAAGYCNMISSEIRIADEESFWLDPCLRFPSPAGEEQLELYHNFSEIIWGGANGELVQPEIDEEFCGEAIIQWSGDKDSWKSFTIPNEVKRWVKLYACAYDGKEYHYNPAQDWEAIGCAIALGHTPKEVIDNLKSVQEALKDAPLSLKIVEIADLLKEIEEAEKQGIEFTDDKMPEPSTVLEE